MRIQKIPSDGKLDDPTVVVHAEEVFEVANPVAIEVKAGKNSDRK
jgi:hypothetical protein